MKQHKWDESCQIYQYLDLLGKKWVIFIIFLLNMGIDRFNDIHQKLPKMSPKILSNRLKLLVEKGVINKSIISDSPVKIRYALTENGKKLAKIVKSIGDI